VANVRAFDNWLQAYVSHMRFSESPTRFHFWTGVGTIAGALRRKVWNDQRLFQWTPNFFIILVGPPGVAAKSTTIRQGLNLLSKVKGVHFGPQSLTWQALLDGFHEVQEAVSIPGQAEAEIMSCLTVSVSELGTFLQPENKEYMDFLIGSWDGQRESFARRTLGKGEVKIINPWLNLIACTTPSWLKERLPTAMISGGLVSRILFIYGDRKQQLVAYPGLETVDDVYKKEEEALLHDLQQIAKLAGEYAIEREAVEWGAAWYNNLHTKPADRHLAGERFQGYLARKWTHIHKLAMVLAAAKRNELVITIQDLQEAEAHVTNLEPDMIYVFQSIGAAPEAIVANEVLGIIKHRKEISYKELWTMCFNTIASDTFKESVAHSIEAGYVRKEPIPGVKDYMLVYIKED
jgi:Protein of unknown function (DUF3987)